MPLDPSQLSVYLLQAGENPTFWEFILESNVINFLIVVTVLGLIIKKFNLFSGVGTTQEKISQEIEMVEKQKREALNQLEEIKTRTANLKAEVEDILNGAKTSAESLSAQILADAREESVKIVENAKRRMELEQRASIKEIEARLLNDALSDARSELARSLTAADQRRSVEDFLDQLPSLKENR